MRARFLLLLALACGPTPGNTSDTEPGSTGSTDAASTSTTDTTSVPTMGSPDATTGEACIEDIHPGDFWFGEEPTLTCGAPELCADDSPLQFELDGPGVLDGDFSNPTTVETDLERARCLIAALRDRTPGQFVFLPVHTPDILHVYGLEILGDLAVTRSDRAECELIAPEPKSCYAHERLRVLRPPEFFASCIDGDARTLWLCLYDSVEPDPACHPGPLACP